MAKERVIIVHLRRPTNSRDEARNDPFWEFGSFGLTHCHEANLMHPRNLDPLQGARLAFAQGGRNGARLLYLTPPIKVVLHEKVMEAKWKPAGKPFRYSVAPILVANNLQSDFKKLEKASANGRRGSLEAQFSSNFRSRKEPLTDEIAEDVVRMYNKKRDVAQAASLATSYVDALPWPPPAPERNRKAKYQELLDEANNKKSKTMSKSNCNKNQAAARIIGLRPKC